jgi:hypothetical protein
VHLKPGPELEKARREVAEYERFRGLVGQVTEVNEAICQARPAVPGDAGGDAPFRAGRGKGGLRAALAQEKAAELGRLASEAARVLGCGDAGMGAAEQVIRAGLLRLGGSMLGVVLAADRGHRGPRVPCGQGHEAAFAGYRDKAGTGVPMTSKETAGREGKSEDGRARTARSSSPSSSPRTGSMTRDTRSATGHRPAPSPPSSPPPPSPTW